MLVYGGLDCSLVIQTVSLNVSHLAKTLGEINKNFAFGKTVSLEVAR